MGASNSQEVEPKVWENQEYGVLPMFCYNVERNIGDEIALHFFEPRYLRLLQITTETQIHCFIYTSAGHPQLDTTAYICSINAIYRSDIQGSITNIVKVNQAWIDMDDRLWWCRFQVVNITPIPPILRTDCSNNFRCTSRNADRLVPLLTFLNHDIPTENATCDLFYNDIEDIRMYSSKCTPTMKRAVLRAATNKNDPEYESLSKLPGGTVWYLTPEHSEKGVDCGTLVGYVEKAIKEVTGSTSAEDIISMLVDLEVSSVKQISIADAKAQIEYADDQIVRCPMSRQPASPCYITKVDFGITIGNFLPHFVSLTPSASVRIFQKISRKVNEERLSVLNDGHVCNNSPLKKLPTEIIEKIEAFLIYK